MAGDDEKPPVTGHEATIVIPSGSVVEGSVPSAYSPSGSLPGATSSSGFAAPGPTAGYRPIQPGDVLNHIFEVKRFIARGGMGEVFEGINVNTDERVAIKVILPHLAADPNIQAMFRKEARTLTRLGHPALVQYRVLAQEPTFGVLYIVTEYVDGRNLSDVITEIDSTPTELFDLIRRLAEGLQAAHSLGAIHRDMSPDNIMLENGALAGARIIDFGIAKDLEPGSGTIIGTGFAGKLNYVAPEQLGDFSREIGPWTDIYSLGLVILAIARRKDVDMGRTMVEAVDKRRADPDLADAPDELRALLARMLEPDPQKRVRSMGELLALLPGAAGFGQTLPRVAPAVVLPPAVAVPLDPLVQAPEVAKAVEPVEDARTLVAAAPASSVPADTATARKSRLPLMPGGAVLLLVAAAGLGYMFLGKGGITKPDIAKVAVAGDRVPATQAALAAALPKVDCAWLDVVEVTPKGAGTLVALRGVAGKPADAQGQIARILTAKNLSGATIDMRDVATIETSECGPLDALRQIRSSAAPRMKVAQAQLEMSKMTAGNLAGTLGATAVVDFDLGAPGSGALGHEMSLFGIQPSGKISQLTAQRADLVGASTDIGGGRYRLPIDVDHAGWSGLLLLTGQAPVDGALLAGEPGSRTGDWSQRFLAVARERGWKAEMVWFNAANQQPD